MKSIVAILLVFVHLSLHVHASSKLCLDVDPKGKKWQDNGNSYTDVYAEARNDICKFQAWQIGMDMETVALLGTKNGIEWKNNRSWNNCIDLDDMVHEYGMIWVTTDCSDAIWIDRFKVKIGNKRQYWWANNRQGACLSESEDDGEVDKFKETEGVGVMNNKCYAMFGLPRWDSDNQSVRRYFHNNPGGRRVLSEDSLMTIISFFADVVEEPQSLFDSDEDKFYFADDDDDEDGLEGMPTGRRSLLGDKFEGFLGGRPNPPAGRRSLLGDKFEGFLGGRPGPSAGRRSLEENQLNVPRWMSSFVRPLSRPKNDGTGRRSLQKL